MEEKKELDNKVKHKTNPNGINQYTNPDPRQLLFFKYYLDPKSKTFSNIYKSGLKAGYSKEYADNISGMMPKWFKESKEIGKYKKMLEKAEKNLDRVLDEDYIEDKIGMFGPVIDKKTKKPFKTKNTHILKVQSDISKFVVERLGSNEWKEKKQLEVKGLLSKEDLNDMETKLDKDEKE